MKGHLKERSPGHWSIVIDIPDPINGKRRAANGAASTGQRARMNMKRLVEGRNL
jgi:hypothetical protein